MDYFVFIVQTSVTPGGMHQLQERHVVQCKCVQTVLRAFQPTPTQNENLDGALSPKLSST